MVKDRAEEEEDVSADAFDADAEADEIAIAMVLEGSNARKALETSAA